MPKPDGSGEGAAALLSAATSADVERALDHPVLDARDVAALLSLAARPHLEAMAQRSARLTRQRFGRVMQLYAPLYVSNECVNRCAYCGFSQELAIERRTLDLDAVAAEAELLAAEGFRHVVLVAGEAPRTVDVDYLERVTARLAPRFDSIAIETGTFDDEGYARLVRAGVDGLVLYQEAYAPDVYRRLHLAGPKSHGGRRLEALERAGRAGFRSLGIGALLGLAPWREEAYALALHGRELGHRHWRSRVAVSFPRIRPSHGGFQAASPVTDADLVQMVCAMRLALPDADLVLSTREPADLRDRLVPLGITRMSAGSRTSPGGYGDESGAGAQFEIEDTRSAAEVARMLAAQGFDPVWKDFDRAFVRTSENWGQPPLTPACELAK